MWGMAFDKAKITATERIHVLCRTHVSNDPDPSRPHDNSLPREMHTQNLWMKADLLCIVSRTYEWGRSFSIVHMHASLPSTMECTSHHHTC